MTPAEKRANDRRFLAMAKKMGERGFYMRVYITDLSGVRHRIESPSMLPACGAQIPLTAAVEFSLFTNCVQCVMLGG